MDASRSDVFIARFLPRLGNSRLNSIICLVNGDRSVTGDSADSAGSALNVETRYVLLCARRNMRYAAIEHARNAAEKVIPAVGPVA